MNRHLVTGGSGFVGMAIVRALLERGERVRVMDLQKNPQLPLAVEFVPGNILDRDKVRASMLDVQVVHHSAALVPIARAGGEFESTNAHGTQIVFEEAVRSGVRAFCHMSSSAVFSSASAKDNAPLTEDAQTEPFEPYGRSKRAAEEFLLRASETCPTMTCAILRPRTVIGPGRIGILEILFEMVRIGAPVFFLGSGKAPFQLIDVRDLAEASVLVAQKSAHGIFHLGTNRYGSLRETLQGLCDFARTGARPRSLPLRPVQTVLKGLDVLGLSPLTSWHYRSSHRAWSFDIQKAQRDLDWHPKFSNIEMLIAAYQAYLRGDFPRNSSSLHLSGLRWGALSLLKFAKYWPYSRIG